MAPGNTWHLNLFFPRPGSTLQIRKRPADADTVRVRSALGRPPCSPCCVAANFNASRATRPGGAGAERTHLCGHARHTNHRHVRCAQPAARVSRRSARAGPARARTSAGCPGPTRAAAGHTQPPPPLSAPSPLRERAGRALHAELARFARASRAKNARTGVQLGQERPPQQEREGSTRVRSTRVSARLNSVAASSLSRSRPVLQPARARLD